MNNSCIGKRYPNVSRYHQTPTLYLQKPTISERGASPPQRGESSSALQTDGCCRDKVMFTDGNQYCNRRRIFREQISQTLMVINVMDDTTTINVSCTVMAVNVVIVVESSEDNQR